MFLASVLVAGLGVALVGAAVVMAWSSVPALLVPPALGRTDRVWVFGRVQGQRYGQHGPRAFRNLRILAGRNLRGIRVEVSFLGQFVTAISGHDGEFEVEFTAPEACPFPPGWHEAEVKVAGRTVTAAIQVVGPDAPYLLLSDFDDTVAVTNVHSIRQLLASTFLLDADTQPPVPGMAELYRSLTATGAPVAFLSGSPVQFAPRIGRFLKAHGFPRAALYLRNLGPRTLSHYKEPVLAQLSERFPGLPLVMIGDSGERDPEIFATFMRQNPERVMRAYVRQATADPGPTSRFEGQLLFSDPTVVVRDAIERRISSCSAFPETLVHKPLRVVAREEKTRPRGGNPS